MAKHRIFWTGALCGAAVAYVTDQLLLRRRRPTHGLSVVDGGNAKLLRIPLKRDSAAGDPALLAFDRSSSRPSFERRGGAPGGTAAAEVHETPGHPEQQLDYSDPAQPVRSASRTQMPARDSQL